jgi:hypothetical protein
METVTEPDKLASAGSLKASTSRNVEVGTAFSELSAAHVGEEPAENSDSDSSTTDSSDDEDTMNVAILYRLMTSGANPRPIFIKTLDLPDNEATQEQLKKYSNGEIWRLLFEMVSRRQKLRQHNTLLDAVELIKKSKKIIVLTGAGVS